MSCALILLTGLYGLDFLDDNDINPSSMVPILGAWIGPTIGVPKWTIRHCPQLFGSSAVAWYVMCIDFLNGILWVSFHAWYWYQSFIDGSNIWNVDRIAPWGPEMDHPPLGRSYWVVVLSYDMSRALIILTGQYEWDSTADIDINSSPMVPIIGVMIGPSIRVPKCTIRHQAAAIL